MTKNIKRMFFVLAIITLLATVGAVCAADDTNTTTTVDNSVSEVATVTDTTSNHITTESVTTTSNNKADTKTIEKENKNLKTATKTVDVNNYDELTSTINSAVQDADNDEYIINLNPGTYQITANTELKAGTKTPNIIINANNQTLSGSTNTLYSRFNNNCNITINDATITHVIQNYANNITIQNSTISNTLTNRANMNLTLINSYLNATISNAGTVTIYDDVILGEKFSLLGSGNVISNRTDLGPYLTVLNGTYTIDNYNYTDSFSTKSNYGNLTINNSTVTVIFKNYGNLTINNSTLIKQNVNNNIYNYGNLTINDSSINYTIINQKDANLNITNSYINTSITNNGNLIIDNITAIDKSLSDSGTSLVANSLDNTGGNLNIINSISMFNSINNNNGNAIIKNSTVSSQIVNSNGTLTIADDVTFGEKFSISGGGISTDTGIVISNKTDLVQYSDTLNGNYTFENQTITLGRTNYGNLTIRNSTINATIENHGTLIICDDVIIGEKCLIIEYSPITINDTSRIVQYMRTYNGTYTLENCDRTSQLTNYGNITIRNVTLSGQIYNYGNMSFENSTLNSRISNSGNLTIADDIIIGSSFKVTGTGDIITNNTQVMLYLPTFSGNLVIENMTISDTKTNNGNLTLINCTTKAITNNGNITIYNSTLNGAYTNNGNITITDSIIKRIITNNGTLNITNSTINQVITNNGNLTISNTTLSYDITNTGILTISDDVEILAYVNINGNGIVIAENMSKIFPHIRQFTGEATVELGSGYSRAIDNYGNLTILNSSFSQPTTNNAGAKLILVNSTNGATINSGQLELKNSTLYGSIQNSGVLIISDDTVIAQSFRGITGDGEIIMNDTQRIADYLTTYNGNFVLENKLITSSKVNIGNLTLNNCTVWMPITNNGRIIIDDDTTFDEDGKITGAGEIITNNITRILPYIDTINGNYTITDTTLEKTYTFNGNVTLENVNITNKDNANFGILYLNNCSVDVGEENIFLDNMGTVYLDKNTQLNGINGRIENLGGETIYEPIPQTTLKVDTTTFTIGETANITASIYYGDDLLTNITKGKVTFKVNGKTIKDANGKVIYAKVVNGTATIENYQIPESWNKDNLTIEAVYSGSNQCIPLRSEKQNITITKEQPTFTTENITTTVGGTINLTATITDGNKVINTGKVVFKINGKTVKDSNGKVIYAKVQNNKVNYEYTLPESYKAKNYTITATLISTDYKLEDTKTLTITKA